MPSTVFDETAAEFSDSLDRAIEAGRYVRGEVFLAALRRHLPPGSSILDYGCGPGRLAALFANAGYRVLGVDPSEQMIAQARPLTRTSGDLRFEVVSGAGALQQAPVDAIVCSSVIEYVPEPVQLLIEFRKWLKPGGHLFLTYANRLSAWGAYAYLRSPRARHRHVQHNLWTFGAARAALASASFRVESGPRFFESPFDRYDGFSWLKGSRWIGTLGLVIARPTS